MAKNGKRKKKPKTDKHHKNLALEKKTPQPVQISSNTQKPSWRFTLLELVDPFGWHELNASKLIEIHEKLCGFEQRTWDEILVKSKKHNHSVLKDKLGKEARDRLDKIQQDDIDELIALRLSSKERVWGIRDNAVLRLLWWHPKHQVCPASKRNT